MEKEKEKEKGYGYLIENHEVSKVMEINYIRKLEIVYNIFYTKGITYNFNPWKMKG